MTTGTMRPICALVLVTLMGAVSSAQYYGKFIGKLSELHHGVSGEVYAIDGRTLFLKDFTYDGQGPAAYFYASTGRNANSAGFRLRDENGSPEVIRRYRKEGVTLTLPEGKTLNNIKIFYVWCEEFEVNFGDVKIPRNFDYPRPQKLEALKGVHGVSSDPIVIVDAQTLLIPNLSYDGEAPDAKFWVGRGPKPSPQGIRVPDENGKEVPLRRYDRKTVVLTLPGDLTVFDIGHFGIWCEAFTVDFGHVQVPQNLNVPPSLKMLGLSPQSKLNCEVLYDDLAFEVRWAVAGDSIVLQLVAKLDDREYMSFGISGDDSKSEMIGGDVVVAWVDKTTLRGHAEDYYLGAKSQCSGPTGSCPDNKFRENSNNIRLLNAAMVNGYSIVTYQRPLKPSDEYDRQIHTNRSQAIIWAVGPLNQRDEVSFHSDYTKGDQFLDFGRPAKWNCPMPESEQPPMKVEATTQKSRNPERRRGNNNSSKKEADNTSSASRTRQTERKNNTNGRRGSTAVRTVPTPAPVAKREAWEIPPIKCYEPEDGVYYAQMGPTGGKRGYPAITGHVGWGISWYINGLLIPEINVVRGRTYTFVVEGGSDPEIAAKYHPFYITDDPVGGYEYKTEEERKKVKIFAGAFAAKDGSVKPTGTGRLCHWTHQGDSDADDFESFGAYQRTLELKCDQGEPGVIQWTPDKNTPDTVYYQCFTHRYLGWKINVHDTCDEQAEASEPEASVVPAPSDLEESPSVRIETMVKPNHINVEDKEDKNKTVSERIVEPVTHHYQSPTILPTTVYLPLLNAHPYVFDYPVYTHAPLHSFESSFLDSVSSEAPPIDSALLSTSDAITSTEKLQTPSITEKLIVATTDAKPLNQSFFVPHMFRNKFVVRRPVIRKPMFPLNMRPSPYFKKPIYRPMKVRLPAPRDPLHPSESQIKTRRPGLLIVKPINKAPLTIKNVEVSPQQASTEKVPSLKVTPSPVITESVKENYFLKPAKNTGFKPESIVMETGFKPIISKEVTKTGGPQLSSEGEIGMIDRKVKIVKHDVEEPVAAAAERVESYYLPPQGTPPQINQRQQASNIDFESPKIDLASPPDIVVTYDGKRVSGASLTAKAADRSSILDMKASKAAELIKARPQFAPFKGDLPPLNPEIINRRVPQLENRGVINRNPETPPRSYTRLRQV